MLEAFNPAVLSGEYSVPGSASQDSDHHLDRPRLFLGVMYNRGKL